MRVRRLLAAVVTVGLVAPAAAVISTAGTSASAAIATTVVASSTDQPAVYSYSSPIEYGDDLSASAQVVAADGSYADGGTITVSRMLAGESGFTPVATDTSPSIFASGLKAEGNAVYRISFSGTAEYAPSSIDVTVQVARKLTINNISGRKAGFKGKVSPKSKVKITVMKKQGKKYKKFKTLKSSKSGKFTVILPAPRTGKFFWKITFAGDSKFIASELKGYTY